MNNQTPSDFCLRPAEPSHYPFALALYLEGAKEHLSKIDRWDDDRFVALFHQGYEQGLRRESSARMIGLSASFRSSTSPTDYTLRQIHLIDGFRGRGIGSTLIGVELKRGAESGRPVTLDVMHGNPARRLYVKLRFESTGKDPRTRSR